MRAAGLFAVLCVICGVAALAGVPAVYFRGQPVTGIAGLGLATLFAAIPVGAVLLWRRWRQR